MLAIRPTCENCNKALPNDSNEAMICTFECTYCKECVDNILHNVCPNCGGGFEKRPSRPSRYMEKYPITKQVTYKPIDEEKFIAILEKFKDVDPRKR